MGRKSLAGQRSKQIISAFSSCILKYGLVESSLEKVATEAGIKRGIIRHYIGNRDKLLKALVDDVTDTYLNDFRANFGKLPTQDLVQGLINYLFPGPTYELTINDMLVYRLLAGCDQEPYIKKLLSDFFNTIENELILILTKAHPQADKKDCAKVAYATLCLMCGHYDFAFLKSETQQQNSVIRHATKYLIESLGNQFSP